MRGGASKNCVTRLISTRAQENVKIDIKFHSVRSFLISPAFKPFQVAALCIHIRIQVGGLNYLKCRG